MGGCDSSQVWLRGATLCLWSGAEAGRTPCPRGSGQEEQPKELWLRGHRRAQRSYPMLKVRKGGGEETPLIQGKKQRLRLAGAAMKRYPMPKVRETQIRR